MTMLKEHLQTFMDIPEQCVLAVTTAEREDIGTRIEEPTTQEVKAAIRGLKSGNATEVDGVTAGILIA